jgi:hypothetical protein
VTPAILHQHLFGSLNRAVVRQDLSKLYSPER